MFNAAKKVFKLNVAKHYWNLLGSFKYYNQKVYFPKNSVIFKRVIREGIYEHDNLSIILPLIKPNTVVFDIGANIGIMAIPMLTSNESIKVVSVEASPNSLPYLKKTNQASQDKNRWIIIDKAVSEKQGTVNFNMANSSDGAYDSLNDTKRTTFLASIEIDCTTIDVIWQNLDKPAVSFIKSDIEGADLLALKGGINCIQACKPSILIEWESLNIAPFNLQNKDLFEFAESINYYIYALPYLNRITSLEELELLSKYSGNFLLVSE